MMDQTKAKYSFAWLAIIAGVLFSCEKTINPELQSAAPVLVVEAWINNKPEKQIVQLTITQPYFDESVPKGVSGAIVEITDDLANVYSFVDDGTNTGTYQWMPSNGQGFGAIGRTYNLS